MQIDHALLRNVWERTSTLSERLAGTFRPISQPDQFEQRLRQRRLERWCETSSYGNWNKFRTRLSWDGINSEDDARALIGTVHLSEPYEEPAWLSILARMLQALQGEALSATVQTACSTNPLYSIFAPALEMGQTLLLERLGRYPKQMSATAWTQLLSDLGQRLLLIAMPFLDDAWHLVQLTASRQPLQAQQKLANLSSVERQRFAAEFTSSEFGEMLLEHPVLARLLATATLLWADGSVELIQRITEDWSLIEQTFCLGQAQQQITELELSLSDFHNGHRTVACVTFDTGRRVIYKPRGLGLETQSQQLLEWFNQRAPLDLRLPTFINRTEYGWAEFISHQDCATSDEVQHYFYRAGLLLSLTTMLKSYDLHFENVIAMGEYPIVIDLETLLSVELAPIAAYEEDVIQQATKKLQDSALNIGILPHWRERAEDGEVFNAGALRGLSARMQQGEVLARAMGNIVYYQRQAQNPSDFEDIIVDGFQAGYTALLAGREELLSPQSPLASLRGQPVRLLFRPTSLYAALLRQTSQTAFLATGIERSIEFDVLCLPFTGGFVAPELWSLCRAEQPALDQYDIPFLAAPSDAPHLFYNNAPIPLQNVLRASSIELVHDQIQRMNRDDLAEQTNYIRTALRLSTFEFEHGEAVTQPVGSPIITPLAATRPSSDLSATSLRVAEEIAETLVSSALCSKNGATWLAPISTLQSGRFELRPLGFSLSAGNAGIALFLAAAARILQKPLYADFALAALMPIRAQLQRDRDSLMQFYGVGGFTGAGSIVYALLQVGQLLEREELIADAHFLSAGFTAAQFARSPITDVLTGTAGGILALLSLFAYSNDIAVLARAIEGGNALLAQRSVGPLKLRGWDFPRGSGLFLGGMAHGAAGIALTLARLFERTHDQAYMDAALEAISQEQRLFSAETGNWADIRQGRITQKADLGAWCHSAPGIALARWECYRIFQQPELQAQAQIALETSLQMQLADLDHLCCGTMGRALILSRLGQACNRPDAISYSCSLQETTLQRYEAHGMFSVPPFIAMSFPRSTFMVGMSGIGYALLALTAPSTLPFVLTL